MEFGGVSLPGRSPGSGGAYVVKDLSVFETQLGGLRAFVMVSDGTADDESAGVAARLATNAADAYLESILIGIATGKRPVIEPALALEAIVAEANSAIMAAAADAEASSMGATFAGALISAEKAWFGSVGEGRGYLLRGDEAHELVADTPVPEDAVSEDGSTEGQVSDHAPAETTATALGREGVAIEVGSADLNAGDVIVLCGQSASAVLGASGILGITCAACDAQLAAASLADAAAKAEPELSVTVAVWSADSSLFAPAPPAPETPQPQPIAAPAPILAAHSAAPKGLRAERIFLWVMSGWIVFAILAFGVAALVSKPAATPGPDTGSSVSQGSVAATIPQEATSTVVPTETVQAEFPKTVTVPKNVQGGLWLRKKPTTLGGANQVVVLKGGAEITAVSKTEGKDGKGNTQEFYVFKVSEISADQVVETASYPWPPPKAVKTVYAFAGSFGAP
jgi:serine/threonine protein phosphatase PrpC